MSDAADGHARPQADLPTRADYVYFLPIQTRWADNDIYGHVNNVVYYAYFDTIINRFLIHEGGLDPHAGEVLGVCVESQCRYVSPHAYPNDLVAGLRVERLGRTSVTYAVALFPPDADAPSAFGHFVHVFVDRAERRPRPLPEQLRAALTRLT